MELRNGHAELHADARVEMIVTLNQRGQLVYKNGSPALLEASLRRLAGALKGQVLHCEDAAYSACKTVSDSVHVLDMNGSHVVDITRAYQESNYLKSRAEMVGHYLVDYQGSHVMYRGCESAILSRGFVARLHVAQFFDTAPDADCVVGAGALDEAGLRELGYVLEHSEYETLPHRAGGPTLAKLRHSIWRHRSATPSPLFLVDNTAWAASTTESRRVAPKPVPVPEPKRASVEEQLDEHTGYRRPNWA